MFPRHFVFVGVLFAAAVVPYAATSMDSIKSWFKGSANNGPTPYNVSNPNAPGQPARNPYQPVAASKPLDRPDGGPVADLAEVIRFDVPPAWVQQRWQRPLSVVSPENPEWTGLRVPLVSGTRPDDLAGSLTYYFTPKQYVRRISFQGTTQDPRRLIELLTSKYDFTAQPSQRADETLYQVQWRGQSVSECRLRAGPAQPTTAGRPVWAVTCEINNFAAK